MTEDPSLWQFNQETLPNQEGVAASTSDKLLSNARTNLSAIDYAFDHLVCYAPALNYVIWLGRHSGKGYPVLRCSGANQWGIPVNRIFWLLLYPYIPGDIPKDYWVFSLYGNPKCVDPRTFFLAPSTCLKTINSLRKIGKLKNHVQGGVLRTIPHGGLIMHIKYPFVVDESLDYSKDFVGAVAQITRKPVEVVDEWLKYKLEWWKMPIPDQLKGTTREILREYRTTAAIQGKLKTYVALGASEPQAEAQILLDNKDRLQYPEWAVEVYQAVEQNPWMSPLDWQDTPTMCERLEQILRTGFVAEEIPLSDEMRKKLALEVEIRRKRIAFHSLPEGEGIELADWV